MAITAVGNLGTAGSATSSATLTLSSNFVFEAMDWILVHTTSYNTSTVDGDNSEVTSVTDTRGNLYTKVGEYTNSNGAAGSGLTVSLWRTQVSSAIGDLGITFTYTTARAQRTASGHVFRSDNSSGMLLFASPITPDATDGSNDFGSVAHGSTPGTEVIYYRALGKRTGSNTQLTPTTDFTGITNFNSLGGAGPSCSVYGEFVIQDSSGKTSNPTLAISGDTAGVFVAIQESDDFTGEARLTQQHAMVMHSTENAPVRMTQQHALVVTESAGIPIRMTQQHVLVVNETADFPVRMTQIYAMVIHSKPPVRRTTVMGNWI